MNNFYIWYIQFSDIKFPYPVVICSRIFFVLAQGTEMFPFSSNVLPNGGRFPL